MGHNSSYADQLWWYVLFGSRKDSDVYTEYVLAPRKK